VRRDCWALHSDLQQWVSGNGSTNGGRGSVRAAPAVCWVTGNVSAVPGSLVGRRREGSSGLLPWVVLWICKFNSERQDRSVCLELWWCWVARLDLRREWVTSAAVGQRCGAAMWCTPSGRFCSSSTVDTSSESMPLLREELLREEVCPAERERIEKGKRKKKERKYGCLINEEGIVNVKYERILFILLSFWLK
jgi:hypothetical protein